MIELSKADFSTEMGSNHDVYTTVGDENRTKCKQGPVERGSPFRFIVALGCVATIVAFASVTVFSSNASKVESKVSSNTETIQRTVEDLHFDTKTLEPLKFHQSGFGALNFHHHDDGASKYRRFLSNVDVKIPVSAVKHAIPSLGEKNILNLVGHYVHDETRSPWSSNKYNRPKEELMQEQKEYLEKMHKVREEWGSWDFRDHIDDVRPVQDFSQIEYRDINNSQWTTNVWQTDETYVKDLIKEGRKLVDRMKEGIYAEFGHPTKKADGSTLSAAEIAAREELFRIYVGDETKDTGFAYLTQPGFDALVRKLLHAMITNDDFYFVLGGHSAAAGHGNLFSQQKTMQFNNIMEPVFQKLGVRLVARNLAMGGYGTLHFSAGQSELYGEKDFLMWDSGMTENNDVDTDFFNKQAIMNGERVPIIMTLKQVNIKAETGGKAWVGDIVPWDLAVPLTESIEQGRTLPWMVQFQVCAGGVPLCGGKDMVDKFDAHCWIDRKDLDIHNERLETMSPRGQASWHPGWRNHRIQSRKAAMLFLTAFNKAFDVWEEGIKAEGFPLAEKYWHVGDVYKDYRETFYSYINDEANKGTSACEKHFAETGHDAWCRHGMHGMSTFRPINLGQGNGILKNLKNSPSGYVAKDEWAHYYTGPDILPLSWKIPDGDVDVHAIAIATSYEAPLNEHLFDDVDDDDAVEDAELGRMLRRITTEEDQVDEEESSETVVDEKESSETVVDEESSEIIPGDGWGIEGESSYEEYCDGSAQSECGRSTKDKYYGCLLHGANDRRNTLSGDGLSGWLVMTIPGEVKNGIIWAKLEWWHPRMNWPLTSLDEGDGRMLGDVDTLHRKLDMELPDDFKFEIAINGKIYDTWDKEKYMAATKEIAYNQAFYKFVTEDMSVNGVNVELALRVTAESNPKQAGVGVAHIYWS